MTTTDPLQPVAGNARIASLDVLRGIAILFILVMNIPWMGGYDFILWDPRHPSWTTADYWTTLVTRTWLEGTQRGLLELLFGAGIMIMARHAMTPDGPVAVADLHYRRNLWLIVFGLANAFLLLWLGDILMLYGIAALLLFPFRLLGVRGQLGFAALIFAALLWYNVADFRGRYTSEVKVDRIAEAKASGAAISTAERKLLDEHEDGLRKSGLLPSQNPDKKAKIAEADAARHGSLLDYWSFQATGWTAIWSLFYWIIQAEVVATMLVGMALYRLGIIQGRARTPTYAMLLVGGYAVGLALRGSQAFHHLQFDGAAHWQDMFADLARLAVTLGHLGLIHLVLRTAFGRSALRPFEAAGRMPLTVYLFTSLLMMWIVFAPWGLDLFGRFGQAKLALIALAVIAAELIAVNLWMRRFENGPLEWLWKSLAYERRQPFRKIPREPVGAVPAAV